MEPSPETQSELHGLIGQTLGGRYKIVRLLGEGGMGAVFQGEQKLGGTIRKVAIKTLHPHLSHDPKILARFERECSTIAELQHPNTIQVYDFGKTDSGLLYIVMEFVEGRSVGEILEKEGPMDPARVQKILEQVAGSLEEAHSRGIIHRDLKPDNVVLCERAGQKDWVEVLDFGIAKRSTEEDKEEQKLTQQGMVLGTPPYMSPEQFTGKPVDARSDIYSLGVMAYEMLSGKLPFNGHTAYEWATQHMTAQPLPLESQPMGARVPPQMRAAIEKALAKRQEDRFSSVHEFVDAFSGKVPIAHAAPVAAAPPGRGKTEVGTPIEAPAYGAAPGYAAPPAYGAPMPQTAPNVPPAAPPHAAFSTPSSGNQAFAGPPAYQPPAAPQASGGKRGLVIGVLAVAGLACVGLVAVGLMSSGGKKTGDTDIFGSAGTGTTAAPTDTTATTGTTAPTAPTAADTSTGGTLPALNTGHATGPATTKPTGKTPADAGKATTPTQPTQPTSQPTQQPTSQPTQQPTSQPTQPPKPPPSTNIPACNQARQVCAQPGPASRALCSQLRADCLRQGGTL